MRITSSVAHVRRAISCCIAVLAVPLLVVASGLLHLASWARGKTEESR